MSRTVQFTVMRGWIHIYKIRKRPRTAEGLRRPIITDLITVLAISYVKYIFSYVMFEKEVIFHVQFGALDFNIRNLPRHTFDWEAFPSAVVMTGTENSYPSSRFWMVVMVYLVLKIWAALQTLRAIFENGAS